MENNILAEGEELGSNLLHVSYGSPEDPSGSGSAKSGQRRESPRPARELIVRPHQPPRSGDGLLELHSCELGPKGGSHPNGRVDGPGAGFRPRDQAVP
jgi:hypothetical protein